MRCTTITVNVKNKQRAPFSEKSAGAYDGYVLEINYCRDLWERSVREQAVIIKGEDLHQKSQTYLMKRIYFFQKFQ